MSTAPERIGGSRGTKSPAVPAWAAWGSQPPSLSPTLGQVARLLGPVPLLPLADLFLQREDRRAGQRAMRQARVAADRIFAVEHCRRPLHDLADLARRELRAGGNPAAAFLDSLALAAIAAQRVLGLRPHLAQMAAAVSILQGRAAELGCGEGKGLALALAAAVRALGGTAVHLVLRGDREVDAQAALLRPFFGALGLELGAVTAATSANLRDEAYRADVCIATARELALDHRLDRHRGGPAGRHRPEGTCAFIDDADALLIDEALVPFELPDEPRNIAPATPQGFFKRYAALGGTSSTLAESRRELAATYGMGVTRIASIYPCFRQELGSSVSPSVERWLRQVVHRVRHLVAARRAVLLTAEDEAACRLVADALRAAGIDPVRVRAWDGGQPDDAGALSGRAGQVAICTDTDAASGVRRIVVDAFARAAGGLAVVATQVATTRRAERRLAYLAGHRGQPGSVETIALLPLPAVLSHLPAPVVRSFVLARRQVAEWRAERERSLRARGAFPQQDPESMPSPRRAHHLQHEGS